MKLRLRLGGSRNLVKKPRKKKRERQQRSSGGRSGGITSASYLEPRLWYWARASLKQASAPYYSPVGAAKQMDEDFCWEACCWAY